MKLVRSPVNTYLTEDESRAKQPFEFVYHIVVEVKGTQKGEEVKYIASSPASFIRIVEEKLKVYRKFGTTGIGVSLPAVVGAKMCLQGNADRGVIFAECLDPEKFLKMTANMGAPVKLNETLTKEVSF